MNSTPVPPRYHGARFELSAAKLSGCPPSDVEVAFAGRSNAGKSSAINAITGQSSLARTGRTPGRTQLINFFSVGERQYLVDLPGYGYAKVSQGIREAWHRSLADYLARRESLRLFVLVMDIRHPLTEADWTLIEFQQASTADLHVLMSKADKLSRGARLATLEKTRVALEKAGVAATLQDFSAMKREGLEDAWSLLDGVYAESE